MTLKSAHCLHSFSNFRFQNSSSAQVSRSDLTVHESYFWEFAALIYAIFGGVSLAVFFIGAENHVWQNVFIGNESP